MGAKSYKFRSSTVRTSVYFYFYSGSNACVSTDFNLYFGFQYGQAAGSSFNLFIEIHGSVCVCLYVCI